MIEIENISDELSESELQFFNECLNTFDSMKEYYLNLSDSFGLKNDTLLLDLKNKAECFISATNLLELTVRRIVEKRIIEKQKNEIVDSIKESNLETNSY